MHSTDNLEDGYLGSGKRLWYSLKKHGRENHVCEVLEVLPNRKDLASREKEIVNEELLEKDLCMNLKVGGEGGLGFISEEQQARRSAAGGKAFANRLKNDEEFRKVNALKNSKIMKDLHTKGIVKAPDWTGRKHSVETILKMKESRKGQGIGSTNSQFGKCWITNENESKKIMKGDQIPEGWRLGRKIK